MGDLTPFLLAIGAAVVGIVGTWYSTRRLRKLGLGQDQATVNQALRELADVWEEKFNIVTAELARERGAHGETAAALAIERTLGSQCRTDLDNVRSELRALQRRRPGARE